MAGISGLRMCMATWLRESWRKGGRQIFTFMPPLKLNFTRFRPLLLGLGLLVSLPALAEETKLTPEQSEFFEKKIRPILVENCYKCHSHDSEKVKGGLLLDTRDGLLKGGDTG